MRIDFIFHFDAVVSVIVSFEIWGKKLSRTCEPELSHSASSPKAPSVSSDCQYCTVESVRTKEQVFISPEGKNPWGVGKIDGRNNVWLAFNCICKQERPKRIRRPIRSDQNTDSTAYKEMLDQANYSLPSTRLKSSYKFRCTSYLHPRADGQPEPEKNRLEPDDLAWVTIWQWDLQWPCWPQAKQISLGLGLLKAPKVRESDLAFGWD